jgi:hypothetical protein
MNARTLLTAVGAGTTTFLLVAVLVIELLDVAFSAMVGLPVGLLAGLAVSVALWLSADGLSPGARRAATAYATFGLAVLALLALRYVNVGRRALSFEVIVGTGLAAVVVVYVFLSDR